MNDAMTCSEVQSLLHLHTCCELGQEEARAVDDHLDSCPACRRAREEHEALRQILPPRYAGRKFFYYSIDA